MPKTLVNYIYYLCFAAFFIQSFEPISLSPGDEYGLIFGLPAVSDPAEKENPNSENNEGESIEEADRNPVPFELKKGFLTIPSIGAGSPSLLQEPYGDIPVPPPESWNFL